MCLKKGNKYSVTFGPSNLIPVNSLNRVAGFFGFVCFCFEEIEFYCVPGQSLSPRLNSSSSHLGFRVVGTTGTWPLLPALRTCAYCGKYSSIFTSRESAYVILGVVDEAGIWLTLGPLKIFLL